MNHPFQFHLLLAALALSGVSGLAVEPAPDKPLYQFTEAEVGPYLDHLQATEPELRQRVVQLARKNLGQPYELYLLGEMPFETYDPQPIYSLAKSDCLVFAEHTLAMALSRDWSGFMLLLQRIRYRDGHLGVATRNHFTETDWNPSNRWLVRDITGEIPGGKPVKFFERIDRSKFLLGRYHLKTSIPVEDHTDNFLPYAEVALAAPQLKDGDLINVVRGIGRARGRRFAAHHPLVRPAGPGGNHRVVHRPRDRAQRGARCRRQAAPAGLQVSPPRGRPVGQSPQTGRSRFPARDAPRWHPVECQVKVRVKVPPCHPANTCISLSPSLSLSLR